ncbi:MAG: YggS family pyridoxal phosphate-dependent enzyme, partial [Bradymonadaceae bacterium]
MVDNDETDQYVAETLLERLDKVDSRIQRACRRADRDRDEVTLVAVTKTHPARAVRTLYDAGVKHFGASYVQEWQEKAPELPEDIQWHFVGHLQSNKAKYVVDRIAMVHSVDRRSVMKQLNKRSDGPVDVLLQINIGGEDSKSGVEPEELTDLLEKTLDYPNLRVRGLMTLPPYVDDPEENRGRFRRMRELFDEAHEWLEASDDRDASVFEHLSMGMTM